MLLKFRRWLKGLCTKCGREKGVWRCGESTCYHCDLMYTNEEQREQYFKFMGWDKRFPVKL